MNALDSIFMQYRRKLGEFFAGFGKELTSEILWAHKIWVQDISLMAESTPFSVMMCIALVHRNSEDPDSLDLVVEMLYPFEMHKGQVRFLKDRVKVTRHWSTEWPDAWRRLDDVVIPIEPIDEFERTGGELLTKATEFFTADKEVILVLLNNWPGVVE